jgi:carbonic anhydrase/acetyltransferase-like protein (isoleucine patch superfamily)
VADNYIAELDFGKPRIDDEAFVAPTAVVVGAVTMGPHSSIWYGAVARADADQIEIGEGSNVQDNSTLHVDPGFPLTIGNHVTIGHNAIVHGCTLEDGVLIGMGSIVMNGARIRRGSVVGAGSVITEGKEFPEYSLIIGAPARVVRTLDAAQIEALSRPAKSYAIRGPQYKAGLKKIG